MNNREIGKRNEEKAGAGSLGLYLHIPFCRRRCLYCDFCSYPAPDAHTILTYADALADEIRERARDAKGYVVDTVYFGGGTPSLLPPDLLLRLFDTIRASFDLAPDAEITLEANPTSGSASCFADIRALGVNRLSIGVQSAEDGELRTLGRAHTFAEARDAVAAARAAGFTNLSLDLMFGIPGQTDASLRASLDALLALAPEHLSIYSLQIEDGTPFAKMRDRLDLPDDDRVADFYETICASLARAGYEHYEISNFARAGFTSRHNAKYWSLSPYLGVGLAAHSDFLGVRSENTKDLAAYLRGERGLSSHVPSLAERMDEYVMLGLRTSRGIAADDFLARFGIPLADRYGDALARFSDFLSSDGNTFRLTERGFEVSNAILAEILVMDD